MRNHYPTQEDYRIENTNWNKLVGIKCSACGSKDEKAYYRVSEKDNWECAECYILAGCRNWPQKVKTDSGQITNLRRTQNGNIIGR